MQKIDELGLRDRKRLATRARVEREAVRLVLSEGLENATVDAISAAADISPRTFFNYFDSKEDAVLGILDTVITDELIAEFTVEHRDSDAIEVVVDLLFAVLGPLPRHALHGERIEVLQRHPQLFGRQVAQMHRMTGEITRAIGVIMAGHDSWSFDDDETAAAAADVMMAMAGSAVKATVKTWIQSDPDRDHDTDNEELRQRAVALLRKVITTLP